MKRCKWRWLFVVLLFGATLYQVFRQVPPSQHITVQINGLTLKEKLALRCLDPDEIYELLMQEEDLE